LSVFFGNSHNDNKNGYTYEKQSQQFIHVFGQNRNVLSERYFYFFAKYTKTKKHTHVFYTIHYISIYPIKGFLFQSF